MESAVLVLLSVAVVVLASVAVHLHLANRRLAGASGKAVPDHPAAHGESHLRTLADASTAGIYLIRGNRLLMANRAMSAITGYSREELLSMEWIDLIHPEQRTDVVERGGSRQGSGGNPVTIEVRLLTKDGQTRWAEATTIAVETEGGPARIGTLFDVTARRRMEETLEESERKYRLLAEHASDVIWLADVQTGRFLYVSPSVEKMRGYSPEEVMAMGVEETVTEAGKGLVRELSMRYTEEFLSGRRESHVTELEQTHKDGRTLWVEMTTRYDRDPATGHLIVYGISRDITERKRTEARIRHMAQHDSLTDLPNRALFSDRLGLAMERAKREKGKLALLYVDLDGFKPVNDTYGHSVGDLLLKEVALRMKSCVRASDTVGRIGGDEFLVLLPEVASEEDARLIAEKLRIAVARPFQVEGRVLLVSASIGCAIYPDDGETEVDIVNKADTAMYKAKEGGGDSVGTT